MLEDGKNFIPETNDSLFDIRAVIETGSAEKFGLTIHGIKLEYTAKTGVFTYLGHAISTELQPECLELQLLVDRTSL